MAPASNRIRNCWRNWRRAAVWSATRRKCWRGPAIPPASSRCCSDSAFPTPKSRRHVRRSFGWLSKLAGACGGNHILQPQTSGNRRGQYFQRQVKGQAGSLLFLANGRNIFPVGCNRPLPAPPEAPSAWVYSGASRLPGALASAPEGLYDAALALTRALGLKGLNGIDFVSNGKQWWLLELEIQQYPTATLELWDKAPMPSLFKLHCEACRGRLPASLPGLAGSLTSAVVYGAENAYASRSASSGRWCSNLPAAGSVIEAGQPLCTVLAAGENRLVSEHWAGELRLSILRHLSRLQPCQPPLHIDASTTSLLQPAGMPAWS